MTYNILKVCVDKSEKKGKKIDRLTIFERRITKKNRARPGETGKKGGSAEKLC